VQDFIKGVFLWTAMDRLHASWHFSFVITGGTDGADRLADGWAKARGIDRMVCPYNWSRGKSGGPWRNGLILSVGKPQLVVAFPGQRGTADMVRQAREAGVHIEEIAYADDRDNRKARGDLPGVD
jgi:hypothetical protein